MPIPEKKQPRFMNPTISKVTKHQDQVETQRIEAVELLDRFAPDIKPSTAKAKPDKKLD